MAVAGGVGVIGGNGWFQTKFNVNVNVRRSNRNNLVGNRVQFLCASSCSSSSVMDPYKTLRIHPGASESEVKKAFRQLALQYHPDVCRGSNCGVQFNLINEAYEIVMSNLRGESVAADQMYEIYDGQEGTDDEGMRGMNDPDWDLWEEWMGWEGAGIRDYSSHINPYI